jgi:hypothetical protein
MCARAQVEQWRCGALQRENRQALREFIITASKHDMSLIARKAGEQNRLLDIKTGVDNKLVEINWVSGCDVHGKDDQPGQESAHGGEYSSTGSVIFVAHRCFTQITVNAGRSVSKVTFNQ